MIMQLREMEPFNIPPVDNHQAGLFTKHLTGNEIFEFNGDKTPKAFLIHSLKYNYPRHSFAHGWLLSVDVDTFLNMCNSGGHSTMEPILKSTIIGSIQIEYGGDLPNTKIIANKVSV